MVTKTPAQLLRDRKRAAQQAAAAAATNPHGPVMQGSAHEMALAQLYEHKKELKALKSVKTKAQAKVRMLEAYVPYVTGVISADSGAQDEVVTTVMVWAIDAGLYVLALDLSAYVIKHNLKLPDTYQRDVPTLLADEFAEAALAGLMPHDQASAVQLAKVRELTDDRDIPDEARAKLLKAQAYQLMGKTSKNDVDMKEAPVELAQACLPLLQQALDLFAGIGVKKDIERLERRLKAAPAASSPA